MKLKHVNDSEFRMYGRVTTGYGVSGLMEEMKKTPLPGDVVYVASVPGLEALPEIGALADGVYGGVSIQTGYCNGHNRKLNALEYHRDSEVSLAMTSMILLIGRQQDTTEEYIYDTGLVEAFFVPAGALIEVHVTTLRYASCQMGEEGFRCVIVLPRRINEELAGPATVRCGEGKLLFARNKWLVGHEEAGPPGNAWIGLKGENVLIQKYEETCFRIVRETELANCR